MSKPTNSIAKVQLPGENEQRPIIPYAIGKSTDNNYQATIEENLTADRYLQLKPERKQFSDTIETTGRHYFGEIVPTYSAQRPWHATYEIEFWKKNTTYNAPSFSAIVTVSSTAAAIGGQEGCTIVAINNIGANAKTSQPWSSYTLFDLHSVYTITPSGISNGYGHLIGYNTSYDVNSNFYCYVRIIETEGCSINLFNSAVTSASSSQSSYLATEYTCATTMGFQTYPAIQSGVSIQNSTSTVYLTGSTSSGTGSVSNLYKNNSVYMNNGVLNANGFHSSYSGVVVDDDDHSWANGYTTYYGYYIYRYWYDEDEDIETEYVINLPEENGTLMVDPNWHNFTLSTSQFNKSLRFAEVRPNYVRGWAWSITYEVEIRKTTDTTQYYPQLARVTISSQTNSNYNPAISWTVINSLGARSPSSGSYIASQHEIDLITATGIDNSYGHLLGFYANNGSSNYSVRARVIEKINCDVIWYDALYQNNSRPAYSYYYTTDSYNFYNSGLGSSTIDQAGNTAYVSPYTSNNINYYLTGTTSSYSKSQLNYNYNVYIRNGVFYANGGAQLGGVYISNDMLRDSDGYELYFPGRDGTIATTDQIVTIGIEDLTSL